MTVSQSKTNAYRLRLDIAITVIIFACLISYLLDRFNQIQVGIEKDKINTQIQHFKLSITEAWISAHVEHKNLDEKLLENSNPMLLIAERPKNYIGELAQTPQVDKSVWYFDTNKKLLIYICSNGELVPFIFTKVHKNNEVMNGGFDLIPMNKEHLGH